MQAYLMRVQYHFFFGMTLILATILLASFSHNGWVMLTTGIMLVGIFVGIGITRLPQVLLEWRFSDLQGDIVMEPYEASFQYGLAEAFKDAYADTVVQEEIIGVAIRHPSGVIFACPRPKRHHHVVAAMTKLGVSGISNTSDQGFVTNYGRYLDREAALSIARSAHQVGFPKKTSPAYQLFSEDMW